MEGMFRRAYAFNQPIGDHWNVSKVTNMRSMFSGALYFNQPLGKWNVENVKNMTLMFDNARAFNQSLANWKLPQDLFGIEFNSMFYCCPAPSKHPLTTWYRRDIFIATDKTIRVAVYTWLDQQLVALCRYGHISTWNTSAVTDMSTLFYNHRYFNDDITQWDTRQVTTMYQMFYKAERFNQPIGKFWKIDQVIDMEKMFYEATSFKQPLAEQWDLEKVQMKQDMFDCPSIRIPAGTVIFTIEKKKESCNWFIVFVSVLVGLLAIVVYSM
jgi:hypothetical protein